MKKILLIAFSLTVTFGALSQWTADSIVHTNLANHTDPDLRVDSTMFEVLPLTLSDPDAWFMHLWWSGDNGFSFAPTPKHNHYQVEAGNQAKMTAITTENYGTGGPPPLTYTFLTEHEGTELPKVLGADTFLHIQTYRNAVIHDTMYLIVTYGNKTDSVVNGEVIIESGIYADICDNVLTGNSHYFPNGELWKANKSKFTFTGLGPTEERSVLIPVRILDNREDFLDIEVDLLVEGETPGLEKIVGYNYFKTSPAVAHSHDPNIMIAESDAKNKCDYRGGKIHYTVKFQNDGDARTNYVRVECHLDEKVDLSSIRNVKVPSRFYQYCQPCDDTTRQIKGRFTNGCGAIWDVDYDTRILTIEMHNIKLYSSTDPSLPRIDMARGQIEFDVLVKDNYIFGKPVVAHSEIFFDSNKPIVTNVVQTGCDKPISLIDGGGFQSGGQLIICQWIWWILAVLLAIILLLIVFLIRSKRKRKKLIRQLEKAE